jgi:hypothetical protein
LSQNCHTGFLEMDRNGKKGGDILKAQSQSADFVMVASGVTVSTQLAGKPQHQLMLPGATLQDALRVIQAAI